MIPIWGDERRRPINLGGAASPAPSHAAILDQAKARRQEREDNRRREESAVKLQAWWRGVLEMRLAKAQMTRVFVGDVEGIRGLRCLVLVGRDEDVLATWSAAMVDERTLFRLATGPDQASWLVLIRQASFLLLLSVADAPQSPHATAHLKVLKHLLAPSTRGVLGADAPALAQDLTAYLLKLDLYAHLERAIRSIPIEAKSAPALPLLVSLTTSPLSAFASTPASYHQCLLLLFTHILTIPLLPNRLPLASLTEFSSRIQLSSIGVLAPSIPLLINNPSLSTPDSKISIIANLIAFTPPRYLTLPATALDTYLHLLTTLMNALPINSLDPPVPGSRSTTTSSSSWATPAADDDDSDSETDSHTLSRVSIVSSFTPKPSPPPALDPRTQKRLSTIPDVKHLNTLLSASHRHPSTQLSLVSFFLSLGTVWPARRERVLSTLVVYTGGGLVRELYRGFVRSSPLGRDDNPGSLMDPSYASSWPPLLFLADLYTQSLLTMGDDEFFSSASTTSSPTAPPRNPLTLDELTAFSRKLLNIAFTLYWREDQTNVQEGGVPGVNLKWEGVREKVTKCLQAIHARDSRKPFTPPGHWLVSSQIDMQSFVEAAVFEEQQIEQPTGSRPLSKRQVAYMSPRLGVLNNVPFAIPFEVRVSIFRHFVANDMVSRGVDRHRRTGRTRVSVRRGNVAQDGFDKLEGADLKAPIEITFIDQFGQEEAGIDGGGVFKEFFTSLCKEVFDTDRGLWLTNKKNELYPNPHAYATEQHSLSWYRFVGRILGKAMYEGILVDVAFAGFFLAKWLGKQKSFLDDLASLDPDLYQGLIFLKHYTGNPEDLSLNFTVAVEEFGLTKTIDLIPNGSNVTVTRENRLQYIQLVSHYRLSKQIKQQSEAFFEGLLEMIDTKWLRMFNQQEVQILLGGVNSPVDLQDLRKHTHYGGLYDDKEETITAFWNVVDSFDQEQRRALLRFVTSCSRPPLLGFKELVPNFAIRDAGDDAQRLPTASTCVNLLKLPRYKNEGLLREKLLQAIHAGAGFDLS